MVSLRMGSHGVWDSIMDIDLLWGTLPDRRIMDRLRVMNFYSSGQMSSRCKPCELNTFEVIAKDLFFEWHALVSFFKASHLGNLILH